MNGSITRITDPFNPSKVWVVKHYGCGNYYVNQEVCGRQFNHRYVRVTLRHLRDVLFERS